MAKIERTQKLFLEIPQGEVQGQDVQSNTANATSSAASDSPHGRKMEFVKASRAIEAGRAASPCDPVRCRSSGIPLGQRQLMTYEVSGTGVFVEGDDLHFVNNAAMQQFWDDIRRTVIVSMDLAHQTLQKRLGRRSPRRPSTRLSTC